MKYLVMECHPGYAVLMDEASRFVRAANLHYEVGQTVTAPVLMQEEAPRRSRAAVIRIAAAAACLLLISGVGLHTYLTRQKAKSSVRLCSELEFEMQLNSAGEVIRISSSTENGQAMLDNYRTGKKDMVQVVSDLLTMQCEQGYLAEGETVSVYIDADDDKKFEEYKSGLETEVPKLNLQVSVQEQMPDGPAEVLPPETDGTGPAVPQPGEEPPQPGKQHEGSQEATVTGPAKHDPPEPHSVTTPVKPQGPGAARRTDTGTRPETHTERHTVPEMTAQQPAGPEGPAVWDDDGPQPPISHPEAAGPPPPPVFDDPPAAEHTEPAAPQEPESTGTEVSAPEIQTGTAPHPELHDEPPAPEQQNGTAPHPELQDEQSAPESQDGTVPAPALHPLNPQAAEIPRI
ncbi:MAG: hypothetical protein IK107_00265 [Oscillospiraceae bacterium]|nr:hypothetical protein [Oscillospiraceae bacterium]